MEDIWNVIFFICFLLTFRCFEKLLWLLLWLFCSGGILDMQVYELTIQVPQSGRSFQMNHLRRCLLAESTPLPQETKYGLQSKTVLQAWYYFLDQAFTKAHKSNFSNTWGLDILQPEQSTVLFLFFNAPRHSQDSGFSNSSCHCFGYLDGTFIGWGCGAVEGSGCTKK